MKDDLNNQPNKQQGKKTNKQTKTWICEELIISLRLIGLLTMTQVA